ncbi:MAG: ParA family protein [Chamaesiphon sp.]
MIVTVMSYKGGVGKTTTAIHLACYIQQQKGNVLLIDGDPNRSCLAWSKQGHLPFPVVDEKAAPKQISKYSNLVIDTAARPDRDELGSLVEGCDLLLLPTTPDALALDALSLIVSTLKQLETECYRVLLTIVPPKPVRDGEEAREMLTEAGLPLLKSSIRRLIAFQRAALQRVPVYEIKDRGSEAWADYVALGQEVIP